MIIRFIWNVVFYCLAIIFFVYIIVSLKTDNKDGSVTEDLALDAPHELSIFNQYKNGMPQTYIVSEALQYKSPTKSRPKNSVADQNITLPNNVLQSNLTTSSGSYGLGDGSDSVFKVDLTQKNSFVYYNLTEGVRQNDLSTINVFNGLDSSSPRALIPAPTLTLTSSSSTIQEGSSITLTWSSNNANSCIASGAWSGAKSESGNLIIIPLLTSSYILTCTNSGGQNSKTVDVIVTKPTLIPIPALTLTSSSSTIQEGGSTTLTWNSTNANSCSASGAWSGAKSNSGSQTLTPSNTGSYVLTCTNEGGQNSKTVDVIVTKPTLIPIPVLTLTSSSSTIQEGSSITLTWNSTNANSCNASGAWSGSKSNSGTQTFSPTTTSAYTLTCTNTGGSTSKTANVTITQAPIIPVPTLTLTSSSSTIQEGSSITLTWSSNNANSCLASGSWSGSKSTNGTQTFTPTTTASYILTCTNLGGSTSRTTNVTVTQAPIIPVPTLTLTSSSSTIQEGGSTTLTWNSNNANSCIASGAWSGAKSVAGNLIITPLLTSSYILTCTNSGGSISETIKITVNPIVSTPTTSVIILPPYYTTSKVSQSAYTYIESFEEIANDGEGALLPLNNEWGEHQTRITSHSDGTIRVLYFVRGIANLINWKLLKKTPTANAWVLEASSLSTDDVNLIRDQRNDNATIFSWNTSAPTVYSYPNYSTSIVPGSYENLSSNSRHYSSIGVGDEGTACIKVTKEHDNAPLVYTLNTDIQIVCGKRNLSSLNWDWGSQTNINVGHRVAYDYIFPILQGSKVIASSQIDLHKNATKYSSISTSEGNYIYNGVKKYELNLNDSQSWSILSAVSPVVLDDNTLVAPEAREVDAYVDSVNNLIISYYVHNTNISNIGRETDGYYYEVLDINNNKVASGKYNILPPYGKIRVFQDRLGRLWLLWSNLGSQTTQLTIYKLNIINGKLLLSDGVSINQQISEYAILGAPMLALPRGGQYVGNAVDMIIYACENKFINYSLSSCYNSEKNKERILYVRIRLAD